LGGDLRRPVVSRAVTPDPGVDAHPLAHWTAQQLIDGHTMIFARDVPQRLVYSSRCAREDGAAAIEARFGQDLPMALNRAWILSNQVIRHLRDRRGDRGRPRLGAGLAPTGNALVRGDAQEEPTRPYRICLNAGDLHSVSSLLARYPAPSRRSVATTLSSISI